MKKFAYTYSILRYIHDVTSGEFVNVGVAIYSPEARYISAICRTTYTRLNKVFPGINAEHFKSLMRHIQRRLEERGEHISNELPLFTPPSSVLEIAQSVLPRDDSSLQWSPVGSGRTDDPSAALEKLFDRMVTRYDDRQGPSGRTDDDVWRHFKRDLEEQHVLQYFQPKKIFVQDDEIEFQHSWKNGKWHCLEPISFDLAAADSIKDKAHKWLGQLASVKDASDRFKVYLLVGAPKNDSLRTAFESAVSILGKIPVEREIVREENAQILAARIAREVADHHPDV
ncbi:MAG: hypothetical protein NFCOHLIN_01080 [Gammaproteobacteria bacterium]|nr:hypothetical protein [Gammaproteobacteria bacterium]